MNSGVSEFPTMDSGTPEKNFIAKTIGYSDNLLQDLTKEQKELVIKELYPTLKSAIKKVSICKKHFILYFIVCQTTRSSKFGSCRSKKLSC
tara:strand:- start:1641 stop:1913 length:273 start_codon:yes stop_codon:yes gene_type:complete